MAFLKEPVPERGVALPVAPGIARIVAANPSVMTYHGTNTYLIAAEDGFVVLDPGPDDQGHLNDILRATGGRVSAILLSHTHADHLGALAALKGRTGAQTFAYRVSADPEFGADVLLDDGDTVAGMRAIHTPGHASDHLCFARPDGVVFTADHIMSWSSSIVSPPGGNMADYLESLRRMLARSDRLLLPGHGPPLPEPRAHIQALLDSRLKREREILDMLAKGPTNTWNLMDQLYSKTDPWLRRAAERNVVAHLEKLQAEGRAKHDQETWTASAPRT